jgi:methylated-DNA-[protein]-cysteine S-methyltransferase
MTAPVRASGYSIFPTAIGSVGVAWTPRAIVAIQMPRPTPAETVGAVSELAAGAPRSEPPVFVRDAQLLIRRHVAGELNDLRGVRVDYGGLTPFQRRVCESARRIPIGDTRSYGEVAEMAGAPGAARAVGQVMATNRLPLIIPCHRVLAAGKRAGGFNAAGGVSTKARLLAIEGMKLRTPRSSTAGTWPLFDAHEATAHLSKVDPILGRHIRQIGPFSIRRREALGTYEMLAESIVYQQLNGKAAATIAGRVKAVFGRESTDTYPPPAVFLSAAEEKLRAAGLSRNKLASIRDLADKVMSGSIPPMLELEVLGDDEIVERLTVVRGIGRWTVEMLLMFRLGRSDVLPADDFGVRKGFGRLFLNGRMPTQEQLQKHAERWRPFRSVASWYMWRAAELP